MVTPTRVVGGTLETSPADATGRQQLIASSYQKIDGVWYRIVQRGHTEDGQYFWSDQIERTAVSMRQPKQT